MSASHPLDRAVHNALTSRQAPLSIREGDVVRFDPDYALFAAAGPDATPADWTALSRTTGRVALFEANAVVPEGLGELRAAVGLQGRGTLVADGYEMRPARGRARCTGPECSRGHWVVHGFGDGGVRAVHSVLSSDAEPAIEL